SSIPREAPTPAWSSWPMARSAACTRRTATSGSSSRGFRWRGSKGSELPAASASRRMLRQNVLHHLAMHIGQAEVAPLEFERQPRVIDPQQMQDRRLQVVNVDRIL